MGIYKKLLDLRKRVSYVQKTEQGAQGVSSSNVLAKVRPAMDELGILLIPSITKTNTFPKKSYGKEDSRELFTEIWMIFEWIDVDDPTDKISCPFYSQGVDMAEKGIGKALTYAEKYFILKSLNIPTDKLDPDTFANKDFEGMTKIQWAAIQNKCTDIGLTPESIKFFCIANGMTNKASRQDTDSFLKIIDEKLKLFTEEIK